MILKAASYEIHFALSVPGYFVFFYTFAEFLRYYFSTILQ